jgi:outer membrane protein OmpA-like peptidoglycan-associated protein
MPLPTELRASARNKSTNADRVLPFRNLEVYMRHPALSLSGPVASRLRFAVITALLAFMTLPLLAQEQPIPAELSFLNKLGKPYRITYEPWTEMQMPTGNYGNGGAGKMVRGKHWQFPVIVPGAMTENAVWAIIKPAFLANGWTAVHEWSAGGIMMFLHYQKNGVEAWAQTDPLGAERAAVDMIEIAPTPFKFTLTPPSATPETVNASAGDFPWLAPLPGSKFRGSAPDPAPFYVPIKGASEPELVASGSIIKTYYAPPDGLSNSLFRIAYHDALTAAGWTIVNESMGADVAISAHFTKNGRNLWASLHKNDTYDIRVADAGAVNKDMGSSLKTNCHVAVYGVLFDFNKSTLQPASDPVLQQILDLLKKTPALKIEVQGHTDNVGGDAYNQTLSEARARAIVTWLTQHGIAAARLTAKGFGKTRPIADNATDAGRAKNRRVEIADPNCAAHPR